MRSNRLPNGLPAPDAERILDSWKEIASYLGRAVRTVQTWEKEEGLPVHRHQHLKAGTVYAYPREIDAWREGRGELANGGGDPSVLRRRKAVLIAALGVSLLAVALGWRLLDGGGERVSESDGIQPASEVRAWLVLANFDNRTGESLLDRTMETALRRELANSSLVKVAPAERVGDALQLMGRSTDSEIDTDLAREVALRDGGIRAILTGRVEKIGSSYLLSVELLNAANGVSLASLSEDADRQDTILQAVNRLSARVRETLGESFAPIDASREILSKVSTPSLRALELYSRADRLFLEENLGGPDMNQAAEELLREAIVEDPRFASSHTHLAWALRRQNRPEDEYLPHAERAVELSARATAVERYFIRGSFYFMRALSSGTSSDLQAALAQYQALLEVDPGHFWAAKNALGALRSLGRGSEALGLLLGLVEARPNDVATLSRTAREVVVATGDLDRARSFVGRAERLQSQLPASARQRDPFLESFPVHESWVLGDVEGVLRQTEQILESIDGNAAGKRRRLTAIVLRYYLELGMFDRAEALQRLPSALPPGVWNWMLAWRGGDKEYLRDSMLRPTESSELQQIARDAAALGSFGYASEARLLLDRLPAGFDLEPGSILAAEGGIHLAGGRYLEAIAHLEQALPLTRHYGHLGDYFFAAQSLSTAWDALGQPHQGIDVLEEASRQKASAFGQGAFWMELRLALADLYRKTGQEAAARAIEDGLRRYTAYADPDFHILLELQRR